MPVPDFRAFTVLYSGLALRLTSDLAISEAFEPRCPPVALPIQLTVKALWDTGATGCVITDSVAVSLGLAPTGAVPVTHAGGVTNHSTYMVNLILPNDIQFAGVSVVACPDNPAFSAIIGMNVISRGDLAVTSTSGKTQMSFRVPSIDHIDYVREYQRILYADVDPSSPCPCGRTTADARPVSFEHCHLPLIS